MFVCFSSVISGSIFQQSNGVIRRMPQRGYNGIHCRLYYTKTGPKGKQNNSLIVFFSFFCFSYYFRFYMATHEKEDEYQRGDVEVIHFRLYNGQIGSRGKFNKPLIVLSFCFSFLVSDSMFHSWKGGRWLPQRQW